MHIYTTWPQWLKVSFCRHFWMNFRNRKKCNFEYNFTEVSSYWSSWHYMFGSGIGLQLTTDWWQAITWTNDDKIFVTIWCHQASTEGNTVSQEILKISSFDMNLKINNLRLQPHFPCANDLRYSWPADQGRQSNLDVWRPHAVSTQYGLFQ